MSSEQQQALENTGRELERERRERERLLAELAADAEHKVREQQQLFEDMLEYGDGDGGGGDDDAYVLHENDCYIVKLVHAEDEDSALHREGTYWWSYYGVFNKDTDIMEFASTVLPEAIANAEHLDVALATKPWEWIREEAYSKKPSFVPVNPDGSTPEH
jgi:hypothetical protein